MLLDRWGRYFTLQLFDVAATCTGWMHPSASSPRPSHQHSGAGVRRAGVLVPDVDGEECVSDDDLTLWLIALLNVLSMCEKLFQFLHGLRFRLNLSDF